MVTSGKGGVGKTTTSASFASGLAFRGQKTVVIDFDVGLRNLDLIMGCERRALLHDAGAPQSVNLSVPHAHLHPSPARQPALSLACGRSKHGPLLSL